MGAHITRFKDSIAVRCNNAASQALLELAGKPKFDKRLGCHLFAFSSRTCYYVVKTLKEAKEIDSCSKEITDAATRYYYALQKRSATEIEPVEGMRFPPWLHQGQGISFCEPQEGSIMNMEMGCGKTFTTIAVAIKADCEYIITMCPKKVIPVWPKEINKYVVNSNFVICAPDSQGMSVAKKAKELEKAITSAKYQSKKLWFITNYDAIWREPLSEMVLDMEWDLMVLDEVHRIKSHDGKASKFAWKLSKKAKKRLGLTGTLMPHSPLDIYAIGRAIDESVFGTSYTSFKHHHVVYGGFQMREVKEYINVQEIHDKIDSITYRVTKEVLDLPPTKHVTLDCSLSKEASKLYKKLYDDLYAEVETGEITVANALVKLLRLQQITGGFITLDDGTTKRVDTSKQEVLQEIFEDLDAQEPVAVFYRFQNDKLAIMDACKKTGRTYKELSGQKDELASWQNGDGTVLVVQIQAGGVGLDMTRTCYVVYYSMGYNMGEYLQSLARADRPGQTRPVTFFHITALGTVDKKVYKALAKRQSVVEFVIEGIKENPYGNDMCRPGGSIMELQEEEPFDSSLAGQAIKDAFAIFQATA